MPTGGDDFWYHGPMVRLATTALFALAVSLWGCSESPGNDNTPSDANAPDAGDTAVAVDTVPLALALLNQHRVAAGLSAVELDESLSEGCLEHVRYMAAHGKIVHEQDPQSPHFTPLGNQAAHNSNLAHQVTGLDDAVHKWLWSLYHRLTILDPGTIRIGAAFEGEYACLDPLSAWEAVPSHPPVPFPAHLQQAVPLEYPSVGGVDPIPDDIDLPVGPAISLLFPTSAEVDKELHVEMLTEDTGDWVPLFVRLPGDPTDPYAAFQRNAVAAIPLSPLEPKTKYRVVMKGTVDEQTFEKQWVFETGTTPGPGE